MTNTVTKPEEMKMKAVVKMTVVIDGNADEGLYANGEIWEGLDGPTVYACDIEIAAEGKLIDFRHVSVDHCFCGHWPPTLDAAINDASYRV